jgi:hypothetical protein
MSHKVGKLRDFYSLAVICLIRYLKDRLLLIVIPEIFNSVLGLEVVGRVIRVEKFAIQAFAIRLLG